MNNNSFYLVEEFSYRILKYLVENGSEDFWKVLYYDTLYPLEKEALTTIQKTDLLWLSGDEANNRIFFKQLLTGEITEAKTLLKIYEAQISPTNRAKAIISMQMEIITNSDISMVYNDRNIPCNRVEYLQRMLLSTLNGIEVGGIGAMVFDRELTRNCLASYSINNGKSFFGSILVFGVNYSSMQDNGICNG